jgi:hypothetical protein
MTLSAMTTIFCSVVLSVIQGVALNTGVLLFQKVGRYRMVSEHSVACRIETLGLDSK